MKKKLISAVLVAAMSLALVACGNTASTGETEKTTDTAATEGGIDLTACVASEPDTIDPSLNSSVDGGIYIQHTFEGLMRYEPVEVDGAFNDSEVVFGQAESVDVSEDGLVYTFHLRDDIYWSDGQPVTANDFVYSWRRLVNPATAADYGTLLNFIENAESIVKGETPVEELGVEATDDKTLVVTLANACAYFLDLTSFPCLMPLREDVVEGNDSWTFDNYVCNGPFVISEWNHDSSIVMVPNEKYYEKDKIGPNSITWKLMDDANAMLADFRSGSLDMINDVPVDETAALMSDGTLKILPYIGTYAAVFNIEAAPFDDPLVRQAFNLAIDRNYICETVVQTGVMPATAWVPSGILDSTGKDFREAGGDYYSVSADDYAANCEKARELLAEAGYPNGEGFPVVEYAYNTNDAHQKIYEALQNMWSKELGVTVTGVNSDWNVFLTSREEGDFQVARHGWIADYNDASNFLDMYTSLNIGGNNYSRYNNPEFDQAVSDAVYESDLAKRDELLHKAEDMMMEDMILAPIYFYVDKACLNDRVDGAYHTSMGYFFFKYATAK